MRIGHVVRQFSPSQGGLEDFVANLAREQAERGHAVRVVTCDRCFEQPSKPLRSLELDRSIEIRRIPYFGSRRYPIAPSVLAQIRGLDLVHVHAVDFFFDFLAHTRAIHGRPLVATTHGGFFHTTANKRLKELWFQTITRGGLRQYDAVVACSRSDHRRFSSVCAEDKLYLIENGADLSKFSSAASPVLRRRVVTLGRFSANKRLDRVLDAFAKLVQADPGWHLDICGLESDWTANRLCAEVVERGLGAAVDLHVNPTSDRIRRVFSQASFFVSASEYEGFGIALVEAMSAGLIPIVHANDAFVAFSKANRLVRIADFRDPGSLANALVALCGDPGIDYAWLQHEIQESVRGFSWASVARSYLDLYDSVRARSESRAA